MYRDNPSNVTPPAVGSGQGYLVIHVTTARGAIPLEGAQITVRDYTPETEAIRGDVVATLISGSDGNTVIIPLDAPPKADSLKPGGTVPYSSYIAEVHLEGYYDHTFSGINIFDGITAILPADLIPLPENGQIDGFSPDGNRDFEGSSPDL